LKQRNRALWLGSTLAVAPPETKTLGLAKTTSHLMTSYHQWRSKKPYARSKNISTLERTSGLRATRTTVQPLTAVRTTAAKK